MSGLFFHNESSPFNTMLPSLPRSSFSSVSFIFSFSVDSLVFNFLGDLFFSSSDSSDSDESLDEDDDSCLRFETSFFDSFSFNFVLLGLTTSFLLI